MLTSPPSPKSTYFNLSMRNTAFTQTNQNCDDPFADCARKSLVCARSCKEPVLA